MAFDKNIHVAVYEHPETGALCVVRPAQGTNLSFDDAISTDENIKAGIEYKVMKFSDLPARADREAWKLDKTDSKGKHVKIDPVKKTQNDTRKAQLAAQGKAD